MSCNSPNTSASALGPLLRTKIKKINQIIFFTKQNNCAKEDRNILLALALVWLRI
jgi:hypothetical protein